MCAVCALLSAAKSFGEPRSRRRRLIAGERSDARRTCWPCAQQASTNTAGLHSCASRRPRLTQHILISGLSSARTLTESACTTQQEQYCSVSYCDDSSAVSTLIHPRQTCSRLRHGAGLLQCPGMYNPFANEEADEEPKQRFSFYRYLDNLSCYSLEAACAVESCSLPSACTNQFCPNAATP